MINKDLKKRIIDISYDKKLSHLGSCLTAVDIIDDIFKTKQEDEKFILSSGHAGLALYVVLEKYSWINNPAFEFQPRFPPLNADKIFDHHGVHPDRCEECHIDCSSGSLGNGLPIAVGMALANKDKNVYCLISDGECMEGSIWEALRVRAENELDNLKVFVNYNGWGAYQEIEQYWLITRLRAFGVGLDDIIQTDVKEFPFLKGQQGHYKVMDDKDYEQAKKILE